MARAVGRLPRILYFINGMVPSAEDQAEANALMGIGKFVSFRNANLVDAEGASALEECDGVAGAVPPRYAAVYGGGTEGNVSGVGAIRAVHDGEPGVNETNALHLQSVGTGVATEEEKRRAYRGPSVGEPLSAPSMDAALTGKAAPLAPGASPEGSSNAGFQTAPLPGQGWQSGPSGQPGAATLPASNLVSKLTGNDVLAGAKSADAATTAPGTGEGAPREGEPAPAATSGWNTGDAGEAGEGEGEAAKGRKGRKAASEAA